MRSARRRRVLLGLAAPVVAAALALSAASQASAAASASATRAPLGHGSYLVTFTNTGQVSIPSFTIAAESPTNIKSSGPCAPLGMAIACSGGVAPGASAQVCYSGGAAKRVFLGLLQGVSMSSAPRTSCPLAGFKPASSVHPWKHRRCIAVYKTWKKTHRTATAKQRKAERNKLHGLHRCPLSILK